MAESLDTFFTAFSHRMGWEPTAWRINVLKTMAQMEGYPSVIQLEQTWNPLDTMHPAGAVGNWNTAGVKIYPNLTAGVEATAQTLEQPNFTNLRETLRTQQVNQGTAADLQLWGWNSPNPRNTILNAMTGGAAMPNGTGETKPVSPWERERGVTYPGTPMAGQAAGQGASSAQVMSWMRGFFQDEPGYSAAQKAEDAFYEDPMKWISLWRSETGEEADVTEAEEALTRAQIANYISLIGEREYNRGRDLILDQMDEKKWTAEQAISEFNAWMSAALEAGKRAETVYGEEKERAVWTRPEATYERPAHRQVMESYGLEYTPERGIPVETMPDPQQMYSRWHQNMGISQQAPATQGGWSGQGVGQGGGAARAFIDELLNKQRQRQGVGF